MDDHFQVKYWEDIEDINTLRDKIQKKDPDAQIIYAVPTNSMLDLENGGFDNVFMEQVYPSLQREAREKMRLLHNQSGTQFSTALGRHPLPVGSALAHKLVNNPSQNEMAVLLPVTYNYDETPRGSHNVYFAFRGLLRIMSKAYAHGYFSATHIVLPPLGTDGCHDMTSKRNVRALSVHESTQQMAEAIRDHIILHHDMEEKVAAGNDNDNTNNVDKDKDMASVITTCTAFQRSQDLYWDKCPDHPWVYWDIETFEADEVERLVTKQKEEQRSDTIHIYLNNSDGDDYGSDDDTMSVFDAERKLIRDQLNPSKN